MEVVTILVEQPVVCRILASVVIFAYKNWRNRQKQ